MIIRDHDGKTLLDSRITNLLIDQNGNHWELVDHTDGLGIELLMAPFKEIAVIPRGQHIVKIKPEVVPRNVDRS